MPRAIAHPLHRRTILLIVAVALLLSQALGLMHRVVHAPQAPNSPQASSSLHASSALQTSSSLHASSALQVPDARQAPATVPTALAALEFAVAPALDADAPPPAAASVHWLDRLFAAHEANACASYDQLAQADFLWSAPAELCAAAVSVAASAAQPALQLAAQAAGYLARGPPRRA